MNPSTSVDAPHRPNWQLQEAHTTRGSEISRLIEVLHQFQRQAVKRLQLLRSKLEKLERSVAFLRHRVEGGVA
jgi:hypothetical protein